MKKILHVFFILLILFFLISQSFAIDEPDLKSAKPLYFRIEFAQDPAKSMVGVIDETGGTGSGYDIVYLDRNMDGNLNNDTPQKFNSKARGPFSAGSGNYPEFTFQGPVPGNLTGKYKISLPLLAMRRESGGRPNLIFLQLECKGWSCTYAGGDLAVYHSAEEAMNGTALRLGNFGTWEFSAAARGGDARFRVGVRDDNGCYLRGVTAPSGRGDGTESVSPLFRLLSAGEIILEKKIEFG